MQVKPLWDYNIYHNKYIMKTKQDLSPIGGMCPLYTDSTKTIV